MSKYYNPRIGAPAKKKANASKSNAPGGTPKSSNKTGKTGTKAGPPLGKSSFKSEIKKNPNSAPQKSKGGSKADIAKKNQEKNKSTQQGKNVSGPKNKAPQFDSAKGGGKTIPKGGVKKDKNYNVGVSKGGVSFGEAFRHFRNSGAKEFTWNGKKYHTKTKEEM